MTTLTQGMEMDLSVFPGTSAEDLDRLKTLDDLDRYTYYVAGCVGEFWTDLMCAYRAALASWDVRNMSKAGVRFGKGLAAHQHCERYCARSCRRAVATFPRLCWRKPDSNRATCSDGKNLSRFRPVLRQLVRMAV